jgi:hypothetical protein
VSLLYVRSFVIQAIDTRHKKSDFVTRILDVSGLLALKHEQVEVLVQILVRNLDDLVLEVYRVKLRA